MRKTQTPQESETLPKNRILIVDDEPDIAQVLKIGLEDNGFVVDVYNDPLDVISNFKADSSSTKLFGYTDWTNYYLTHFISWASQK
jgi:PleD family two-component response regulator